MKAYSQVRSCLNSEFTTPAFCFDILNQLERTHPDLSVVEIWKRLTLALATDHWDLEQDFITLGKDNQRMRIMLNQ